MSQRFGLTEGAAWWGRAQVTVALLFVWALLVPVVMLSWGVWPRSVMGWLVVVLIGPIAAFLVEVTGELLLRLLAAAPGIRQSHQWVTHRTTDRSFSWLRVSYLLAAVALAIGVILVAGWWWDRFGPSVPPEVKDFWQRHFGQGV